ncbi:MAG: MBL fold metallo-hydrolase [Clostridia bacterium]|nr:MBL fold metallo-hydrolase [Clostridia bacterium]
MIKVITHSCIRITEGGTVIYADPFHMPDDPRDGDIILITHDHFDHFSPEDIKKAAKSGAVIAAPEKMAKKAADETGMSVTPVKPGGTYEISGLPVGTVPAYNILKPFHPKSAGWVGYIVTVGGRRIYIAGDTDVTPESKKVKCDVAMLPVGGKYTMTAKEAAALTDIIKPAEAIPTHYGTVVGSADDGKLFASLVGSQTAVTFG